MTLLALASITGCSSTSSSSASSSPSAEPTIGSSTTTAATVPVTVAPTVPATAAPTTVDPDSCSGADGIPSGADIGATILGDVDGDLADDTITEYSLNGVPHVHSQLASGGHSDAEVQIGNADHVEISFYDFDYSLGAPTKPAVAVLAIGATSAGSAAFAILTNTIHYCIAPWHLDDGSMFVGRISAQGPFEGLFCDHAAGNVYNNLTYAEPDQIGGWNVTTTLLHHNFTLLIMDAPQTFVASGTEADIQAQYGDIVGCDHAPLFP
ncbi:MAG: hypothetical protein K8R99_13650 [Actinomycetia bacterium]|nr:hypothetical protein [Actinomycetes bacterium]